MKGEVLTIGDEVLRGEIVDSNKAFISERLLELDIECHHQVSIRDDEDDMRDAFQRAIERSDVILVSGGLGPTRDDMTTEVLAKTLGRSLVLDPSSLEAIREFFARVGHEMAATNKKQALFPEDAEVLANPVGTAPGFLIEERGALIFCLPGVPRELHLMMDQQVLPRLTARAEAKGEITRVRARLLRTFGMGESTLESELAGVARDGNSELSFRTSFPDNFLRVTARGSSSSEADARIEEAVKAIREILGDLVYGEGDESLELVAGRLLAERGATVAVAESCTGGLIAQKLTDIAGASRYFLGGVIAYSNQAKEQQLGVPGDLIREHGAVSEAVALAMAEGVRSRFGADLGIATTGISGPDGGTPAKPVGLVCVALSGSSGLCGEGPVSHVDHFVFNLDRARHRILTAQLALDWIRRVLVGTELVGPGLSRRTGGGSTPDAERASQ